MNSLVSKYNSVNRINLTISGGIIVNRLCCKLNFFKLVKLNSSFGKLLNSLFSKCNSVNRINLPISGSIIVNRLLFTLRVVNPVKLPISGGIIVNWLSCKRNSVNLVKLKTSFGMLVKFFFTRSKLLPNTERLVEYFLRKLVFII